MVIIFATWRYREKKLNEVANLEQIPAAKFSETYTIDDNAALVIRASQPIRPLPPEEVKRFHDMLLGLTNFEITDFVDREKLEKEIDQDIVERVAYPLIPPVELDSLHAKDEEPAFDFDKIVSMATEASHARRDEIRKRLLIPKYFTAALAHLADKSLAKEWFLGEDITITKGFMPPGESILNQEEAQIFFDAFLKLCTDKGIKAKLGPCLDTVQVNRKSFEEYRARIMGE